MRTSTFTVFLPPEPPVRNVLIVFRFSVQGDRVADAYSPDEARQLADEMNTFLAGYRKARGSDQADTAKDLSRSMKEKTNNDVDFCAGEQCGY